MLICSFNSPSTENVSVGANINFNLASVPNKDKRLFLGVSYDETLTATFQIAKIDCNNKASEISNIELSYLMRWLSRKDGFYRFKLIQEGFECLYALANFNVQKITIAGRVYGLELTMTALHPYLLEEQEEYNIDLDENKQFFLYDNSDEIGHTYPNMIITCKSDGDLEITNAFENRTSIIKNCSQNEEITINGEYFIISTSLPSHNIQNDFNYVFPRIANTFNNRENVITANLPCNIRMNWSPVRKVGF